MFRIALGRLARLALAVALLLAGASGISAAAEPDPPAEPPPLYEVQRAIRAAENAGLRRVSNELAAGRTLRTVHLLREEVFVDDEPWPTFLNGLHVLSREKTIRRELLFRVGEPWNPVRAAETVRNIRNVGIVSMVAILPVLPAEGEDDGTFVDAVVYTRDLWSLRLESSFSFNNNLLNQLSLQLLERNFLGRNIVLGGNFELLPATTAVGDIFWNRRLFDTRMSLSQSFDLIINNRTGKIEGTRGAVNFGLPIYELRPLWGFDLDYAWSESVGRQLQARTLLAWDNPATPKTEAIPRIWDRSIHQGSLAALRQFGTKAIHRLRVGYALSVTDYGAHKDTGLASLDPRDPARAAFEQDVLPVSRQEAFPFVGWEVFEPTWVIFSELGAFGLAEEIRVGPWMSAFGGAPLRTFGSRVNALTWRLSGGLVLAPESGRDHALIDFKAGLAGRLQEGEVIDQVYEVRLRAATPRFFGRLAMSAHLEVRHRDTFRTLVALGGDNGLRGYPSQAFFVFGADRFRVNFEWRSPPFVLGSVHFGGVLFYDAGGVGDVSGAMAINHGVGAGLRLLFPQFNRFVFRFDLGVPLNGDPFTVSLSIGSSQLLALTPVEDQKLAQ